MNISVPDDLAQQVRELDIPISHVCQQALRSEVLRVKMTRIPTRDLEALAERLFDAGDLAEASEFQCGYDEGMEWALKYASSMEELKEIASLYEEEVHFMVNIESMNDFYSAKLGQSVSGTRFDSDDAESRGFVAGVHAVLENVRVLARQQ
jgi:hypothetical protein